MNQKANNIIIGLLLILAIILLMAVGHYKGKVGKQPLTDTLTITRYDTVYNTNTVTVYEPKPYKVETVKVDTVYLKDSTEIELKEETKLYKDSVCQEGDTIFQELLIQGINAKVLYAKVLLKKQFIRQSSETIINNHIEKKKKKSFSDHLYIGVGYTAGYDPFAKRPAQVVGLSAGIRF